MIAKAFAWMLVLIAGPAMAAPCYNDGDVISLEGTATRQAPHEVDPSAKPVWVLSLASPVCVLSTSTGQGARQQSNVSAVQIIDATPTERACIRLTGKLVTGNVSGYYAVP